MEPLNDSVTGHPVFVNAYAQAMPVLRKYAEMLGGNADDPMFVLQAHEQIHDVDMWGSLEKSKAPGVTEEEKRMLSDKVMASSKDLMDITRLYSIIKWPTNKERLESMETWVQVDFEGGNMQGISSLAAQISGLDLGPWSAARRRGISFFR